MRRNAALVYNQTGQTLSVRIPNGMPTSATFAVFRQYTSDDATAEFSGTATVSTVNTTITAPAGPSQTDPQLLTTTVTGIAAGSRYLLAQNSVKEWIDVVTLALDGAWRAGFSPEQIISQLNATLTRNEKRKWPDWRTMPTDKAIEHVR